ncbi:hypothetical protein BG07_4604 [Bacillus pseudomycoides]|uniref:hypothetical protein n=1 Tax=Bacillus TaxID=1386 RepID=UPI00036CAE44|nr:MULTISPECIES: hypothetical protein [Bacillus]AIK37754.1 hypothetical protein DJ92_330 [Bacillus pseudomycoides]AJI14927.1 hypothetical protein BG07_4604 [Bacillus pseudomycoides]MCX2824399.1 hypothetical protein [Bacillus sp. DHT2]MDR4915860.1 hypothetical protein [Bacillus pseudomycoides]MEB3052612.1 hypothetical protein [Bacillus pseudomycoides]
MYKLPLGLQIPDRIPDRIGGDDYHTIQQKRARANIVEGYKMREIEGEKFQYFTEINIDADRIWHLFVTLVNTMIKEGIAYGIVGMKGEEPVLSRFTESDRIMNLFKEYKFELTNDGFLQFGIATEDGTSYNEIFVTSFKTFQVWSENKSDVLTALNQLHLKEYKDLDFIHDFPIESKALSPQQYPGIRHYTEVLEELEKAFSLLL